jgi:O-antigen/teichoic acid export membrane protein
MIVMKDKDVIWAYLGQFFSLFAGLVTLPFILSMLTPTEIGMNYLLLTLGSLVTLFDFGFTPQFSRNITYIFSGAQNLQKEGVLIIKESEINFKLLATMISTAKYIYRKLAFFVLLIMLTFGTIYIYYATDGFKEVENSLLIWCLYSLSIFFNLYYSYYATLLLGKGMIMETNKAIVFSKILYIFLALVFLYFGWGLISIVLANLFSPFLNRYISYRYFFTPELVKNLNFEITKIEKLELFEIIWYNSKKLGLVFIGSYAINKFSVFIAGIYLGLSEIASYGLMIQIFTLIGVMANILFSTSQPVFSSLRTNGENEVLIKKFSATMITFYFLFIIGSLLLILYGSNLLALFGSNIYLPQSEILIFFSLVLLLEINHSNFATFIVTDNKVPFVIPSLIAGFFIALGDYISLEYTSFGILGLVFVQFIVQLVYANWKWPLYVLKEFKISFIKFLILGKNQIYIKIKFQ